MMVLSWYNYLLYCVCIFCSNYPVSFLIYSPLALEFGFDNYATVRSDPDLADVHKTPEFDNLMDKYDKRFRNPLGIFGRKKD